MSLTFISAGAGSGKTFTLTQTLSQLLKDGNVRPAGVLATTFTKKAATELRERVRQHLLQQGDIGMANAMGQASIGTVNSVCGALLERFAFEAGMPTRQQVIEDGQATVLVREAIHAAQTGQQVATLSRLANLLGIEDWTQDLKTLVSQARGNNIAAAQLQGFAQYNADELLAQFSAPLRTTLTEDLYQAIQLALPQLKNAVLADAKPKKNTANFIEKLEKFARQLKNNPPPWSEWVALSKDAPEKALLPLAEPVLDLARACDGHPQLHADIRQYLTLMFELCEGALEHYRVRKLALGVVDFTDQEHLLLQLLDHPEVAAVLQDELDLLLVDEFQDTSPIQLALFLKLSKLARNTYWVGDIKQAIYGFRGSDTALMQSILQALPSMGGSKQVLSSSWRSRPALVHLVNTIFTKTFAAELASEEIALQPQRKEVLAEPALAHWTVSGKNATEKSNAIAQGVRRLLASGMQIPDKDTQLARELQARDIAILCYSHSRITEYAAGLHQAGVAVATSRPGLLATPEATLALACLRRLNDSADTVATAEIISLADGAEPEEWLADRLTYLAQQGASKTLWRETGDQAHPLVSLMASLRKELPLLSPLEALQRVISAGQLSQRVLAWRQDANVGRQRLANLETLLEMAAQYEDNCSSTRQAATISGLLLWLTNQAAEEQDAQAEPSVNAVRLLTHHAAKGLEWPVVILADLDHESRSRLWGISAVSTQAVQASDPLAHRVIRYWPWPFGKQAKGIPVLDRIEATETATAFKNAATAEAQRLLYVSMTRARELMVLTHLSTAKQEPWLESLGADWLCPSDTSAENDITAIELPSGEQVPTVNWVLAPALECEPQPKAGQPVYWFADKAFGTRLPLYTNPSAASRVDARAGQSIAVGERISLANPAQIEWGVLGSALHACLATSFTDVSKPITVAEVSNVLRGFDVLRHIAPEAVHRQIQALHGCISQNWPGCKPLAEVPVKVELPNGQIMNGRIDLLLDTPGGWVLIDHKSSPLGAGKWDELVSDYAGQLAAYAQAIELSSGRKVVGQWLFLPVAGQMVAVAAG
ncbi:MAG: UvrD-helicase domain-containing protein [Rhodoferax sp.]|jgi:ATP-dependent helicase/nuclease subunit A|uniref:UvrD-helicase domain-containing protein n=1 Tax=Rhodoferax sp. TaxID=50421 RepID=UPI001B6145C6|nr:UvrD-helicase domain-containing protein [Rhodoferax sp.]MBP9735502.1 UvrD-helicase domain-containing protein [Rhodoferax sp.]